VENGVNIRSVTLFTHPGKPLSLGLFPRIGKIVHGLRLVCEAAGFEVQSTRLATVPFPSLVSTDDEAVELAVKLEELARRYGVDFVSVGPALPDFAEAYGWITDILGKTSSVFASGVIADLEGAVYPQAALECARVMRSSAPLEESGFANLRFAALAGVPPFVPFFPAAYAPLGEWDASVLGFSLAVEAAPVVVRAFSGAKTISEAKQNLAAEISRFTSRIANLAEDLGVRYSTAFLGIDFSFAPFPEESASLGTALESLGVASVGTHGSLAAAAIAASVLDEVEFPRTGFNGLMFPVLEDAILARRAAEGALSVKDLLLYSAVCGTGLDTVPIPGDVSAEQIQAVLLDVATLAVRLRKPLTARLLPVPGKKAGEPVHFDFPYFADSAVLPLDASPLGGALAPSERFTVHERSRR